MSNPRREEDKDDLKDCPLFKETYKSLSPTKIKELRE